MTMVWAGPFGTRLLAEMGAEVIKVESPSAWDNLRTLIPQPGMEEPWNTSFYFNDYNRDKKGVTLDLAHPRGRELFLELVRVSDVVIENYRADVLDRLDLGYEVLRQVKPDIILVSMAGFGKTGAERDQVGYGPIIEMMAGLASTSGYGDDGMPYKSGISYGDPIAGAAAAGAVALALIRRRKTGKGAFIDLAQRETMATLIGGHFVAASLRGEDPVHRGNRDPRYVPQGAYQAKGEEQWLVVSVRSEDEWRRLAGIIGAPELAALTREERQARHDELDAAIERWTQEQDPQQAMETLQREGIPAGRVLNTDNIHDDPQLVARGFWVELPHPVAHSWRQPSSAWRLVEANPHLRRHAPLFGEHNREVLQGLLGVSDEEMVTLAEQGVIGDRPLNPTVG
jgi:crotonobetainyl-CoA:carnitine CoA-transferase CaiB-like acyl-CoA transferase